MCLRVHPLFCIYANLAINSWCSCENLVTLDKALSLEKEKKNEFSFCILLAYSYLCNVLYK